MLPSLLQSPAGHPPPSSSLRWARLATIRAFHQEPGKSSIAFPWIWSSGVLHFRTRDPNICTRASENRHLFSPHSVRFSSVHYSRVSIKKIVASMRSWSFHGTPVRPSACFYYCLKRYPVHPKPLAPCSISFFSSEFS